VVISGEVFDGFELGEKGPLASRDDSLKARHLLGRELLPLGGCPMQRDQFNRVAFSPFEPEDHHLCLYQDSISKWTRHLAQSLGDDVAEALELNLTAEPGSSLSGHLLPAQRRGWVANGGNEKAQPYEAGHGSRHQGLRPVSSTFTNMKSTECRDNHSRRLTGRFGSLNFERRFDLRRH